MAYLRGPATLTYSDGRSFVVDVDLDLRAGRGRMTAAMLLLITDRGRPGLLECGRVSLDVLVVDGHPSGNGSVVACSKPIIH